jgi:hypothetical protein
VVIGVLLAGVAAFGMRYWGQARVFVAAAAAPKRPATVRVNFSSDPDGATVVRADGMVMGVTPLSVDVKFGDVAVPYVIRLDGYVQKTTSVVPNVASPVFALLERDQPAPWVEPVTPGPTRASAGRPADPPLAAVPKRPTVRSAGHQSPRQVTERVKTFRPDGDETLAPSAP